MLTDMRFTRLGLDMDVWMLPPSRLDLTAAERESISDLECAAKLGPLPTAVDRRSMRRLCKAAACLDPDRSDFHLSRCRDVQFSN
jgi:penicillin-insensitive murein endopeptidase